MGLFMGTAKYGYELFNFLIKYKRLDKWERRMMGDKVLDFVFRFAVFFTAALVIWTIGVIVFEI